MSEQATETPVLDLLTEMTAESIEASNLDPETLMLVRIAALVAVDAPPVSYLMNIGAAGEAGVGSEQVQGVLAGVRAHARARRARGVGAPALGEERAQSVTCCGALVRSF